MKPIHLKVLRISTGLGLIAIACRFIYNAILLEVVQGRGTTHSLEDSPTSFCLLVGIYILAVALGFALVSLGWRDNSD